MHTEPHDGGLKFSIIRETHEWDEIEADWNALFESSPAASAPLHFDWMRCWWNEYAEHRSELTIICIWNGSALAGLAPLYVRVDDGTFGARRLGFISTGEHEADETCPDYLDLLYVQDLDRQCAKTFWRALGSIRWDYMELLDLRSDSPLLVSPPAWVTSLLRGSAAVADIEDGVESYIASLSSRNARWKARRQLRAAQADGVEFALADASNARLRFQQLTELHQLKWESRGDPMRPGAFASRKFTAFHARLVDAWVPDGRAVLACLSVHERPVAVLYGFIGRQKFDLYQSGVTPEKVSGFQSPGLAATLMLMRQLHRSQIDSFDLLKGDTEFKRRYSNHKRELYALQGTNGTLMGRLHALQQTLTPLIRRVRALLSPRITARDLG